jgi:hypothetical protein
MSPTARDAHQRLECDARTNEEIDDNDHIADCDKNGAKRAAGATATPTTLTMARALTSSSTVQSRAAARSRKRRTWKWELVTSFCLQMYTSGRSAKGSMIMNMLIYVLSLPRMCVQLR